MLTLDSDRRSLLHGFRLGFEEGSKHVGLLGLFGFDFGLFLLLFLCFKFFGTGIVNIPSSEAAMEINLRSLFRLFRLLGFALLPLQPLSLFLILRQRVNIDQPFNFSPPRESAWTS